MKLQLFKSFHERNCFRHEKETITNMGIPTTLIAENKQQKQNRSNKLLKKLMTVLLTTTFFALS